MKLKWTLNVVIGNVYTKNCTLVFWIDLYVISVPLANQHNICNCFMDDDQFPYHFENMVEQINICSRPALLI